MSDYHAIPIVDSGEPLVPIPPASFVFTEPPPYTACGAPYAGISPWQLRRPVLQALLAAQQALAANGTGWRLKLFDAYRPLAVQTFMVMREFHQQAAALGLALPAFASVAELQAHAPQAYQRLAPTVFTFWSLPSADPLQPPPHSTGAAVDLTLVDAAGQEADMGCPIDETTPRAYPEHFAAASDAAGRAIHQRRQLLHEVMRGAGFSRHRHEWWHFSLGDQMHALASGRDHAVFGRADKVESARA